MKKIYNYLIYFKAKLKMEIKYTIKKLDKKILSKRLTH